MNEKAFLQKLYHKIYGVTKSKDILNTFEKSLGRVRYPADAYRLRIHYEPFISFGRSVSTIKNVINDFKRIIKNSNISDTKKKWLISAFSLPEGYYYAVNEASEKALEQRKEEGEKSDFSIDEFEKAVSDLYEKGMDKSLKFWNKKLGSRQTPELIRAYHLATYLALVTGRRLVEILKTMKLRKYRNSVRISGILKKKEKDDSYDLLVLDDPNKVVEALRELRKIFNCTELNEKQCSKKYSAIFSRFVRDYFKREISFHDLRALYGEVAYAKNREKLAAEGIEKSDFVEAILLHEKTIRPVDFYLKKIKVEE